MILFEFRFERFSACIPFELPKRTYKSTRLAYTLLAAVKVVVIVVDFNVVIAVVVVALTHEQTDWQPKHYFIILLLCTYNVL